MREPQVYATAQHAVQGTDTAAAAVHTSCECGEIPKDTSQVTRAEDAAAVSRFSSASPPTPGVIPMQAIVCSNEGEKTG